MAVGILFQAPDLMLLQLSIKIRLFVLFLGKSFLCISGNTAFLALWLLLYASFLSF